MNSLYQWNLQMRECCTLTCCEGVTLLVVWATESVCKKDATMDHPRINFTPRPFEKHLKCFFLRLAKCLLPVHFQPGFNALQNHRLHAIHQGNKIFSNNSVVLSGTGISCWHIDYLWLGIKTWPTLLQFLDHMILDLFYLFLRNLVPFVAHEQSTLGWDWFFLPLESGLPYFIQQLF